MSHIASPVVRALTPNDAFTAVLLLNSTQEPHFHITSARLVSAVGQDPGRDVVVERDGRLAGLASLWFPDFHSTHAWVGLHLHPDHRTDGTAQVLLDHLSARVRDAGRPHLWASVREDYLPTWPALPALGFRETHRTFGGGFHLEGWSADLAPLESRLAGQGYTLESAAPYQGDACLAALYDLTRGDKRSAPPTIPPAADRLTDEDALWKAAFLARHREEVVGLALPERSGLGAWNAALVVHPEHRRGGLGTALQGRVVRALQAGGVPFLNTAGVAGDAAYLGVLRRLGANIEPDWIAFERPA